MAALAASGLDGPVGRLGILGGTFDPIHDAHLALARAAKSGLELDAVLFVPAGDPWRKQDRAVTPARHRLAMVRLALGAEREPGFAVSSVEVHRSGPTYSEETLEALQAEGHGQLWFICGADALSDLPHWHDPGALVTLARFAVAPRLNYPLDLDALDAAVAGLRAAVDLLAMPPIDLSASDLRGARRADGSLDPRIPAAAREYIVQEGLYAGPGSAG